MTEGKSSGDQQQEGVYVPKSLKINLKCINLVLVLVHSRIYPWVLRTALVLCVLQHHWGWPQCFEQIENERLFQECSWVLRVTGSDKSQNGGVFWGYGTVDKALVYNVMVILGLLLWPHTLCGTHIYMRTRAHIQKHSKQQIVEWPLFWGFITFLWAKESIQIAHYYINSTQLLSI